MRTQSANVFMDNVVKFLLWLRIAIVVFLLVAWAVVAGEGGFEKVAELLTGLILAIFASVIAAIGGGVFFSRLSQQVPFLLWIAVSIIVGILALVAGVLFASETHSCMLSFNANQSSLLQCQRSAKITSGSVFSLLACLLSTGETIYMIFLMQDVNNAPKQI